MFCQSSIFQYRPCSLKRITGSACSKLDRYQFRRNGVTVKAGEGDKPQELTIEQAYKVFGLNKQNCTFDDIINAKAKLMEKIDGDDNVSEINAAYDLLLMNSMKSRLSGETTVSNDVRFADVQQRKPTQRLMKSANGVLNKVFNVQVQQKTDQKDNQAIYGGVFILNAALIIASSLTAQPESGDGGTTSLAVAFIASLYFHLELKKNSLKHGIILSSIGLFGGIFLFSLMSYAAQVDVSGLGPFTSGAYLISFGGVLGLWAQCALLA